MPAVSSIAHEKAPGPVSSSNRAEISIETKASGRGWRFWAIFASLALTAFLSSLEGSVVATALPAISRAINAQADYVWIVNVYFLTSAAVQPLYGQLADLWGRRWLTIGAVALFTLGSGICGGSSTSNMLISGRAVQGLGAAGINMLVELILVDLLPLRDRGKFLGLMFVFIVLGSVTGPFIGGILVERVSWRWCFYLNLPFGGGSLILLYLLLRIEHEKLDESTMDKIKKIDFIGLLILCGSISSLLFALTYGGTRYEWSHPTIVVTLIMALLGVVLLIGFEASPLCPQPMIPLVLFANRTSAAGFIATFIQTIISYWVLYFIPVYFQSTLLVSPSRSGLQILPFSFLYCFSAAIGGGIVSKLGRFKHVQIFGFALITISLGTFTIWDRNTSTAVWMVTQLLCAFGMGVVTPSLLTTIQSELPPALNAASTATFAFVRSVGTIFGVSIPAAIFNNRFDTLLPGLHDDVAQSRLSRGQAYEQASPTLVDSFPMIRDAIITLYELSLRRVWQVAIIFAGVGFLAVLFERDLHSNLDEEVDQAALLNDDDNETGAQETKGGKSWADVERRWIMWEQEMPGWRNSGFMGRIHLDPSYRLNTPPDMRKAYFRNSC
ncbi:putative major facilitator superfamily protein [Venustampulla echinocandica]|uniref:Putative major facilitator superfamily protein n=1 Tax=Venustampulla echinocandica TaxID=2656787 RepID=A0A370TEX6_9HELO|nr:putative major facilitator superfamily protein [Venustampulla echinocandica]RDL33244.1 putative major facilitator superfamily protein [Venustampulla echinocandica]